MKKILSLFLAVLMIFSCLNVLAYAGDYRELSMWGSQVPVVSIYGDGEPLYDKEGNKVFHFSQMLSMLGDTEDGALGDAVINVLMPFLLEGVLNDQWDNYYDALEKEIGELFAECRLDNNGENVNGVDISDERKALVSSLLSADQKEGKGFYAFEDYMFYYDWRLDPLYTADLFNAHIKKVKEVTGADKVAIVIRCLGSSVVMAYIAKYGLDDIHGISFDASVSNGAEIISEPISGKFTVDANAINRMIKDFDALGMASIDSFITSSIDLLEKTYVLDSIVGVVKEELYAKIVKGVTSALALSTFFTWPNYWTCVTEDDYDNALNYVFGPENSEKRKEYAGLIEKIENYNTLVREKNNELMLKIKDSGCNVCIISKYGLQIAPVIESRNEIGDQFVTAKRSSYGATTSTVYDVLEEDYIAQRIGEKKGKYISPDKQIDASTCIYPDYTWFIKGSSHSAWNDFENSLLYTVATAEKQLTVDDFECGQFIVYNNETGESYAMTEDNCDTEAWDADLSIDEPETKAGKIYTKIAALISWLLDLILFISKLTNKQ